MQMALAVKSGKKRLADMPEGARDKIKKIVDGMSKEKIKHFTKTNEAKDASKGDKLYSAFSKLDDNAKRWLLDETGISRDQYDSPKSGFRQFKDHIIEMLDRNTIILDKVEYRLKLNEDGEGGGAPGGDAGNGGPSTGAATLSNTVGRGSYEFGNNPQNGNSDTKKGSGEPVGNGKRKLTPEEEAMLGLAQKTNNGEMKLMGYEDFKAKAVKENFTTPRKITEAINTHFGDFGEEAHTLVGKLPVVDGMIEIISINEALSGKYKKTQIRKVIDAISDKRSS